MGQRSGSAVNAQALQTAPPEASVEMNSALRSAAADGCCKAEASREDSDSGSGLYSNPSTPTVRRQPRPSLQRRPSNASQASVVMPGPSRAKPSVYLSSDPNFKGLAKAKRKRLEADLIARQYEDGETIFREGEFADTLFFVTSGTVLRTSKTKKTEREHGVGAVVGCVGLVYETSHAETVTAKGATWCLSLAAKALWELPPPLVCIFRRIAVETMLCELKDDPFRSLTPTQLQRLTGLVDDATFEPQEVISASGDTAQLILLVSGQASVLREQTVTKESSGILNRPPRNKDVEFLIAAGECYGDQELSDGTNMLRTMVATTKVRAHRITYESVLEALDNSLKELRWHAEVKRVLSDIFLFRNLRDHQIDRTVRHLWQHTFPAGEIIVSQGDPSAHFFLIRSGRISVTIGDRVVRTLGRWDYFGERGLLLSERRSATCQALEVCECLVLDADVFFEIVGMFRKELERRIHLQDLDITLDDLWCLAVIGRGAFGVVRLVRHKTDHKKQYALKGVKKLHVVKNCLETSILMERDVNQQCYHPCIVQFIKTFQDNSNVYFLLEFLGGGDLFSAIRQIGTLTKEQSRFFSGSVVLAIEFLHARSIMYRDLKPENVLLDMRGYAKLVDFGCCKQDVTATTLIGTPDYIAPEMLKGQGYTCAVDWWSLGVMMYEFIVGPLPFQVDGDGSTEMLFKVILEAPLLIPPNVSDQVARSVLTGLLERRVDRRLGSSILGAKAIIHHPYYEDFAWDALAGGFLEPPWQPCADVQQASWEAVDSELKRFIGTGEVKQRRGMEWALSF